MAQDRLRIFISGNDDVTSDIVFGGLFDLDSVEVVGVADVATYTKRQEGKVAQALRLKREMATGYWLFLVFLNGGYAVRKVAERMLIRFLVPGRCRSLAAMAAVRGVPYYRIVDFNGPAFLDLLRGSGADLHLVRIPQILSAEAMAAAPHGTWCLHSSLLPAYGGYCAEFHALARGDDRLGATLFKIVEGPVDKGPQLYQGQSRARLGRSLLGHVLANNRVGRAVVKAAIAVLERTGDAPSAAFHPAPAASYFRWPGDADIRAFHARGGRLASLGDALRFLAFCAFLAPEPPFEPIDIQLAPEAGGASATPEPSAPTR